MFLLLPAAAAEPDPLDLDTWEARAREVERGPSGCWELEGTVTLKATGFLPMTRWSRPDRHDYRFEGPAHARIEDGRWTVFVVDLEPVGEKLDGTLEIPVYPLTGRMAPDVQLAPPDPPPAEGEGDGVLFRIDETGDASNVLRKILDGLQPETAVSFAEWHPEVGEGGAVKLFEEIPVEKGSQQVVKLVTTVPGGGPHASALDVTFPARVKAGDGGIKVTLFDAQGHVRSQPVGDTLVPALESLSFGLGALGFTVGYEQSIAWREVTPCTSAPAGP